jgi:hypothetical protein
MSIVDIASSGRFFIPEEFISIFPDKSLITQKVFLDFHVESNDWLVFMKTLAKKALIPCEDIHSHYCVYKITKLCEYFLITDLIPIVFQNFTSHNKWVNLIAPEYMYLIAIKYKNLVDFKSFFKVSMAPFKHLERLLNMDVVQNDDRLYLEILEFYNSINPCELFDTNDNSTFSSISLIKKDKSKYFKLFLITPFAIDKTLMVYTPFTGKVWKSSTLCNNTMPTIGSPVITDYGTFIQRFDAITHGLLYRPINDSVTCDFPWKNVIVAGGCVTMCLEQDFKNRPSTDIDLFIFGDSNETRIKTFDTLLKWFYKKDHTYYVAEGLGGAVKTVYISDVPRKFQIINTNFNNPFDVINNFDFSYIQTCVINCSHFPVGEYNNGLQAFCTTHALNAFTTKTTKYINMNRVRPNRIVKTLFKGYDIEYNEEVISKCDVNVILSSPGGHYVTSTKEEMNRFFYPKSKIPELNDSDEVFSYNTGMIRVTTKASHITNDVTEAMKNIAASGAMVNTYTTPSCVAFNPACIVPKVVNAYNKTYKIQDRCGDIIMHTPDLTVKEINETETDYNMVLCVNEQMKSFINVIESTVFRQFTHKALTKHLIINECFTVTVNKRFIEFKQKKPNGFLRDRLMRNLCFEDDLTNGNIVQFVFKIILHISDEHRYVELYPTQFIRTDLRDITEDTPTDTPTDNTTVVVGDTVLPKSDAIVVGDTVLSKSDALDCEEYSGDSYDEDDDEDDKSSYSSSDVSSSDQS